MTYCADGQMCRTCSGMRCAQMQWSAGTPQPRITAAGLKERMEANSANRQTCLTCSEPYLQAISAMSAQSVQVGNDHRCS